MSVIRYRLPCASAEPFSDLIERGARDQMPAARPIPTAQRGHLQASGRRPVAAHSFSFPHPALSLCRLDREMRPNGKRAWIALAQCVRFGLTLTYENRHRARYTARHARKHAEVLVAAGCAACIRTPEEKTPKPYRTEPRPRIASSTVTSRLRWPRLALLPGSLATRSLSAYANRPIRMPEPQYSP
jgi:hypothetical protein